MTPYLPDFLCEPGTKALLQLEDATSDDDGNIQSRVPFGVIMLYARTMTCLRLVPGLGCLLEICNVCVQGDVPQIDGESKWGRIKRRFKCTCLNTFDAYGSHQYQHHKSAEEILALTRALQPDKSKVLNMEQYFLRPSPIGCALRVFW